MKRNRMQTTTLVHLPSNLHTVRQVMEALRGPKVCPKLVNSQRPNQAYRRILATHQGLIRNRMEMATLVHLQSDPKTVCQVMGALQAPKVCLKRVNPPRPN
ncbi:c17.2 [Ichnoviriform fugitivi]|uniref:C17.2 n=1 Tax=Ichnoviriform fugitivi TaxID=265522 RepID=A2Q0I1_9VIRU|nr:c17.2 [Ichnoviriform fugitivi]BAF45696.1 c17.2 [Ichnoviriform fugitivi]